MMTAITNAVIAPNAHIIPSSPCRYALHSEEKHRNREHCEYEEREDEAEDFFDFHGFLQD